MRMIARYDVLIVKRRFSGLSIGEKGVCSEVGERNGMPLWTVLMANGNTITILGKEVEVFFKWAGKLPPVDSNEGLLKSLLSHGA